MVEASRLCTGPQRGCTLPNLFKRNKYECPSSILIRLKGNGSFGGLKHCPNLGDNAMISVVQSGGLRVSASVATVEKCSTAPEIVLHPIEEISGTVKLPSSKSLSNWILLLAALFELGATVKEGPDYCVITPPEKLNVTEIDTYDDYIMAMTFSLTAYGGVSVTIKDPDCTRKTFPAYFNVL